MKPASVTRRGNATWALYVGDALRQRRMELYKSQREAVDASTMGQSTISEIEHGIRVDPTPYIAYADLLKADLVIAFGPGDRVIHTLTPRENS